MKQATLFFLLIISLFSCTIEKRRYFKGYHVESGKMRKWENGRMTHSTSSGTTRSTGSGTGEVGKRESVLEEQCAESGPKKPQRGDIIIAGEIAMDDNITAIDKSNAGDTTPDSNAQKPQSADTPKAGDDVQDDNEIKAEPTSPHLIDTGTVGDVSRGGDVGDVTTIIFGLLALVAYGIAVLFLVSSIFAIDNLILTVLLMIGGGFALIGLVFTIIWALLRRKYAAQGQVSGLIGDPNPDENRPHGPWGLIIPCIIFSGFTVLFLIQLGSSTIELSTFLGLLLLAGAASILAILFGVLAIIRIIQLYNYDKGKESTTPGQYSE